MFTQAPDRVRPPYAAVKRWLDMVDGPSLCARQREAESVFRRAGISFAVHGPGAAEDHEQPVPFDVLPRVFSAEEWRSLERGLTQRARAINAFLADAYGAQEIVRAGALPAEVINGCRAWRSQLRGIDAPGGVHAHVVAIDIARLDESRFVVVEDNCRIPSGVSYMLEDRETMSQLFPDLVHSAGLRRIDDYPQRLRDLLGSCRPSHVTDRDPTIVVLTPGAGNSAYYEHFYLADQMGVELVEGADLHVEDGRVWVRTTAGPQVVDVIYRRIDDAYLDPLAGERDSLIGVPELMQAYRDGQVSIVNAPGCGLADDKSVFPFVSQMIRFYLGETPLLESANTWRCAEPESLAYVLEHLRELVIKPVDGAGAEGVVIGPHADESLLQAVAARLRDDPAGYIAQETLSLSRCPRLLAPTRGDADEADAEITFALDDAPDEQPRVESRHVDFRGYVLCSPSGIQVLPGGLTRVAQDERSLIVNTRYGGGVKDTWVLTE